MPPGDAGLERQADKYNERGECLTCGSSAPCAHDDLGTGFTALAYVDSLKAAAQERDKLREQVAAMQAVVDAARWIEEDGWTPVIRGALMEALRQLPAERA